MAGYSAPRSNAGVLEQLLTTRHEIAGMMGASSYAHYQARVCNENYVGAALAESIVYTAAVCPTTP